MRIIRNFAGTERQLSFAGIDFPECEVEAIATFDAIQIDCNLVPCRYEKGDFFFSDSSVPLHTKRALDLVWTISGTPRDGARFINGVLTPYLISVAEAMQQFPLHSVSRILWSDNPKYKPKTVPRLIMVRIFRDEDFDCTEHPEMLSGEPIGQYHCPMCANMQIAGTMHVRD